MLSRTADHLFWMSRCTERGVLFTRVNRGNANNGAKHLLCVHQKTAAGGLSSQHCLRAQRVRGFLPEEVAC